MRLRRLGMNGSEKPHAHKPSVGHPQEQNTIALAAAMVSCSRCSPRSEPRAKPEPPARRLLESSTRRASLDSVNPNLCPVCGYDLGFPPWKDRSASHDNCMCCLIEFGYHDWCEGKPELRSAAYDTWRKKWITEGMKWHGGRRKPPEGWDPVEQLKQINVTL